MTSRAWSDEQDYAQMRRLVTEILCLTGPPVACTLGELDWWRFPDEDRQLVRQVRLWVAVDGRVVGFVWPGGGHVDIVVHPAHTALVDEMLAWAEDLRRSGRQDGPGPLALTAWAFAHDLDRQRVLARRGYAPTGDSLHYRARPLPATLSVPPLPAGYVLTSMREPLIVSRVAAHRDAFRSTKMTDAKYRSVMRAPTYRPELDLMVLDPDGDVAAFALVWWDPASRSGIFEPVGTRVDRLRRGLARVLLSTGMARLRTLGATTALVVSGADEPAANGLYDALGLATVGRHLVWSKPIA